MLRILVILLVLKDVFFRSSAIHCISSIWYTVYLTKYTRYTLTVQEVNFQQCTVFYFQLGVQFIFNQVQCLLSTRHSVCFQLGTVFTFN